MHRFFFFFRRALSICFFQIVSIRFPASAADLIRRLLTPNATFRLGNLSGGMQDITGHLMLVEAGLDWAELAIKRMPPPHKPKVRELLFFLFFY